MDHDALCAAAAGVLGRIPCHPLDTIKTVAFVGHVGDTPAPTLRTVSGPSSAVDVAKLIYKYQGVRGFFRGGCLAVAGAAPGNVLYLLSYDAAQRCGDTWFKQEGDHRYRSTMSRTLFHLTCGLCAEAISCVVWVPVDVVKERLQAQQQMGHGRLQFRYRNARHAFRTILKHESFSGLYRGYTSTLMSFGPFSGVYFVALERADHWHPFHASAGPPAADSESLLNYWLWSLSHAAAANVVASVLTNPLEMIKTRLQVQRAIYDDERGNPLYCKRFSFRYSGLFDGIRSVAREEGLRGLWRGTTARVLYACPNAALTMALFRSLQHASRTKPGSD